MARFKKNSPLARLAKLTSDGVELLSRINKFINVQKENEENEESEEPQ